MCKPFKGISRVKTQYDKKDPGGSFENNALLMKKVIYLIMCESELNPPPHVFFQTWTGV